MSVSGLPVTVLVCERCRARRSTLRLGVIEMTSAKFTGFGSLKTPADLLEKLRYDFGRLRRTPTDVYAAFDFFVTAYHMLDWLHPNDDIARKAEEADSPLLQVCSHLANGAKHFEARAKQHQSVANVIAEKGEFFGGGFFGGAFFGELSMDLDGQAALVLGQKIDALALAQAVLAHWENDTRLCGGARP